MDWTPTPSIPPASSAPEPAGLAGFVSRLFGTGGDAAAPPPPDPYSDDTELLKTFDASYKVCFERRSVFQAIWWRNLLYVLSRQWIYYDRQAGRWLDKRLQRWIPKPVTNKISETVAAIMSVFQSVTLAVSCKPVGADPKDVQAAEAANKYEGPLRQEHDFERIELQQDFYLTTLGNVFLYPWWNPHGEGTFTFVPYERCDSCQTVSSPADIQSGGNICPTCGQPFFSSAVDEAGQPIGQRVNHGRGCTDVVSPLELAVPPVYTFFDDAPLCIRVRWRPKTYCEDHYDEKTVAALQWEQSSSEETMQLYRGLSTATELGTMSGLTRGGAGEGPTEMEGITEYELWMKPCKKYPDGLVLRVAGEGASRTIIKLQSEGLPGPLPLKNPQGQRVWPWIHIGYEYFGGRLWARSPLDLLIEKQNQLNQIDSLMQLIIQRTANPVWLEPKGAEVKHFTGEPGLVVKWNPLIAGGNAKPERIEGANVPSSLVAIREMILSDIENLAGTYDIIKGQKPAGVEAFSALQLLVERSQSRYGPVLQARGRGYRRWFQIAIEMERAWGPPERILSIQGPNGGYIQETFAKADLSGSIRMEVEDGSQMPKTSLGKRAAVEQLRNFGVINPQNPDTAYRILQIFGATDLWPGLDTDVQSALREQDEFERWARTVQFTPPQPMAGPTGALIVDPATGQPGMTPPQPSAPPPGQREAWHNDIVHVAEHRKWANSDTMHRMMTENPDLKPAVTWMIQQHEMAIQQQQAMQAAAAGPPKGAGKDGNGIGGGRALGNSNRESGNPNDVPSGLGPGPNGMGPA